MEAQNPSYDDCCRILGHIVIESQIKIHNLANDLNRANERADQALALMKKGEPDGDVGERTPGS